MRRHKTSKIESFLATLIILMLAQVAQIGEWPMLGHDHPHTSASDEVVGGLVYVGSSLWNNKLNLVVSW